MTTNAPSPVRVAHIIYGLGIGGLEQLVVGLSSRGHEQGIASSVISFGPDGPLRGVLRDHRISLTHLGDIAGMRPGMVRRLASALNDSGTQVAHAHDLGPWLNATLTRTLRPRMNVVATFHQLLEPRGAKRLVAIAAARATHSLVACGSEVHDEIRSWAPRGRSAEVITIGNGVTIPTPSSMQERARIRKQMGLPSRAIAIGYLGRLHEEKGPQILIEAFRRKFAGSEQVHLVVIGGGPLEKSLRRDAQDLPNVHFMGEVASGASELLQGMDLYAQASIREGRSLSLLEAMGAGLPTVAHRLPAIAEIHTSATALLVPPRDIDAFGTALDQLVSNQSLRHAMGEAARRRAELYSADTMTADYAALYRKAARG